MLSVLGSQYSYFGLLPHPVNDDYGLINNIINKPDGLIKPALHDHTLRFCSQVCSRRVLGATRPVAIR